ncbi:MAG: tetratricopeptide repeat protein [Gammaproteobacteria bacterium]|nr:tetratricopeptide repeat protein [Gammaproteobacteria bacterium]
MTQAADVFVSYSRDDKDRVLGIVSQLRDAGVSVWIDQGGIDGASQWGEVIVNALDGAKVLLLMVSESAVRSHNVLKEVVLVSERKGNILPLMLEPTTIPPGLKYPLAGIQQIDLYQSEAHQQLEAVVRSLQRLGVPVVAKPAAGNRSPSRAEAAPAENMADSNVLAVLPFENLSPDPETDYFSDGLTEELIARLSLVSEIELVSRWASMQYKGQKQDIRQIGIELGTRFIVGGSVRRFQDSVRITVQLVDAATNRQVWGNTYKGKLDDIFDIQEQVAQQIVEALKLKLSFSEKVSLTKRQTVNAQAYDLYLKGQEYLYRMTKRSVEYSIQLFEKAIELDPRYAAAYANASSAYGQLYQMFSRQDAYQQKAQELSFKALMYDSNLAEAYRAMGLSYSLSGKFEEAEAACRKAIELDPDDFLAYWTLGRIQFSQGNLPQALDQFNKVVELKPAFYAAYPYIEQTCRALGRTQEALAASRRVLELLPDYLLQNPDDARARSVYAMTLASLGKPAEAVQEGTHALELSPGDPLMLYNVACLFAQLQEIDRSIDALQKALKAGYWDYGWMKHDPDLNPLRDDARFHQIIAGH